MLSTYCGEDTTVEQATYCGADYTYEYYGEGYLQCLRLFTPEQFT
jgi:hypothetical protein